MKYLNDTQTARLWAKIKAGFVAKSGDTMTGALTLAGDPVSDLQAATKKYVDDNAGALPSQTGQSGKFLTTDGTDASWATVDALPSQSGKNGKYLKTNGTVANWEDGPAQTAKIWTGYCTTAADTEAKVVVLDDPTGFSLSQDNRIAVRFVYGIDLASGSNPTLDVNDTGALGLYAPSSNGINLYNQDADKLSCSTRGTCIFSFNPGLDAPNGGWMRETSGFLLSKAYAKAMSALPVTGGAMAGALTLSGAPTADRHAATKKYVDDSIPTVPTKVSDLQNDAGYITGYTETDPTVPSWAKASSKPSYTAGEVGAVPTTRKVNGKALSSDITLSASDVSALPSSTSIPSKTSDLTNDSGFITDYTETDPTVPSWAKASSKPSYTAAEVGAQAKITASGLLKGDGSGNITAAVAGTDYIASHQDISGKLDKSGGTMTGALTLSGEPTNNLHAATKKYVDDILDALPIIPTASTTSPSMDGTASYGSGTVYARSNHVHPTDTSRQAKITASGLLKGDGSGGVSAATAGTDYAAASHSHGNITSGGDITATAPTIASGDQLVINDNSASKITNGPTFDGSTTTKALTPKGTWETFLTLATLPIYDGTVV